MIDIDVKSLIFGMLIAIIVVVIIMVVKKYVKTTDAYGKLERVFELQKRFNTEGQEAFQDRGGRTFSNGFDFLSKSDNSISAQAKKLVDKTTESISNAVEAVAETVQPQEYSDDNVVDNEKDVAPTSGLPIETSPVEGFGTLRYTNNLEGITGQSVQQSKIAQMEANENKTTSLSQQAFAEKMGFKTL